MVTNNGFLGRMGWLWTGVAVATQLGCGGVTNVGDGGGPGASPGPATCGKAGVDCGATTQPSPAKVDPKGGASGGNGSALGSGESGATGGSLPGASGDSAGALPKTYSGHGFVVHEWGTDTIVVGSDGSLQRGLHHEEEDLPAFVYDRVKAGSLLGATVSVNVKMETPVTYFYSDRPLSVAASVSFPKGVLTQWYPQVASFMPLLAAPGSILYNTVPATLADPALDLDFPFQSQLCEQQFGAFQGGRLDWGNVEVLPRGSALPEFPAASLDQFSWSYARDVDSNPLRVDAGTGSSEAERFLFYRGLGDFDLPVKIQADLGGQVTLRNAYAEAIPRVFVLNVDGAHGAFSEHPEGIAPGASLSDAAPSLAAAPSLDRYADDLGARVTDALDAAGLFHDEARAMVNTWKRQWFRTPGVRLLYLIPQSWTDQSIPLSLTPAPDETLRLMLIRVEVITPEQEADDVAALGGFSSTPASASAHFQALGRFAEPRLRRALALSPSPAGAAYLTQIQTSRSSLVSGQ